MTVTILETINAPDGQDFSVLLANGKPHTFHASFDALLPPVVEPPGGEEPPTPPPFDAQAFCDNAEAAMLAAMESPWEVEAENGQVIP